ncbi:iron-sulfur cluster insertion protein ErpA [Pseudomonas syringae pv. actinidiae]|nr:iron-sulfur cluster insertion protein ErpA [Pseudomonas syringae pv. actinidiae]
MSVEIFDFTQDAQDNEVIDAAVSYGAGIDIEDSACGKITELIEEEGNPGLCLRMFIVGGGCSGFSYGFSFTDEIEDDDISFTKGKVKLLVDPLSYQYLSGATVRFKDDLLGARFTIDNPNATTTCGCGQSFSA